MSVRFDREKSKMQEKYQIILSQMLKEEDNKYCVDCDTKNPRWASWNIGVFICIRCAGFHRNLGVHISKVKSINLDSWTAEQIASMQAMGNSRARAVYEANLPDGFRRPQSDSTLESFIRAKYEQRKWIAKEWIPPEITVPIDLIESENNHRHHDKVHDKQKGEKIIPKLKPFAMPRPSNNPVQLSPPPTIENNTLNLLDLDEPLPSLSASANVLDPLQEIFTQPSPKTEANAASPPNNSVLNNGGGTLTNANIMALFNTPITPVVNARPASNFYPPAQHSHLVPHQKSVSYGNNLYQQSHLHQTYSQPYTPTLQSPVSLHTQEQLNNQFSQLRPFANTKSNTSASSIISQMPIRPVTEYMPSSSDTFWQ